MEAEATTFIDAPPERVWRLISDVTRMGQWSPVTYRCEWVEGSTGPAVGARFKGYNKMAPFRWWTLCEITACEPGRVFEFRTIDGNFAIGIRGKEMTRWRYAFDPEGIGTRVTETYSVALVPPILRYPEAVMRKIPGGGRLVDRRRKQTYAGMDETLRRLKEAAES
jgi:uncharacterized protein YndB with AHSA1/START domain